MSAAIENLSVFLGLSENGLLALGLGLVLMAMIAAVGGLAIASHRELLKDNRKRRRRSAL